MGTPQRGIQGGANRHRRRAAIVIVLGVTGTLALLAALLSRELGVAEVKGGEPRLAASDQAGLRSLLAESATVPQLEAAGSVFRVGAGVRCRVLRVDSSAACRGARDNPIQVQLLDGSRRGEVAWFCFSDVRFLHRLP
jgi:hypothetical protein